MKLHFYCFSHFYYSKYYKQSILEIKIVQGVTSTNFRKFIIIAYADVTDTEVGLIAYFLFDIFGCEIFIDLISYTIEIK
jgi:hypothetical protein